MTVKEMHYDLSLRLDKLDSLHYDNLLAPEKDVYLNRAQITIIKQRYGLNNSYLQGFEESQKRIEDLKTLVVKACNSSACEDPLTPILLDSIKGIYRYNLNELTKGKYMIYISCYTEVSKNNCILDITPKITQHDDIYTSLFDDNYSPSFEWKYLPIVFSEHYIYAYTNNEFQVGNLYIDYLRYPKEIRYGNYNDELGNLIPEQSCELPDYLHHEILDLTETLIKKDLESPTVDLSYKTLQINE